MTPSDELEKALDGALHLVAITVKGLSSSLGRRAYLVAIGALLGAAVRVCVEGKISRQEFLEYATRIFDEKGSN